MQRHAADVVTAAKAWDGAVLSAGVVIEVFPGAKHRPAMCSFVDV